MATWKKVLTKDSAVGSDGLLFVVEAASAEGATLRLSDGTNVDDVVLTAGTGIDFSNSSEAAIQIDVDTSEITSAIQGELTDATLVSSTSGDNVVLTLTRPSSETDSNTLTQGSNITLTEDGAGGGLTIAATDTNTQLGEEAVQDFAWNVLGGTQTGIVVTYQDATNDVDFVVADQTLTTAASGDNIVVTMSNPTTNDTITVTAGDNITLSDNANGGFTITGSATASNVSVSDVDDDATHYLVFTTSTAGSAALKVDSSTLQYNASSDTLTVNNLTVAGTQTTVNTTELVVADKNIVIADGSAAASDASGAGITVDIASAAADMPQFLWTNAGSLTGWSLSDYVAGGNTDFPVSIMEFSSNSTAPSGDAGGVGSFHFDTGNDKLYIRTA